MNVDIAGLRTALARPPGPDGRPQRDDLAQKKSTLLAIQELATPAESDPELSRALAALLFDAWQQGWVSDCQQAWIITAGKIGDQKILELLTAQRATICARASLVAAYERALLLLKRRLSRAPSSLALTFAPGLPVRLHCRTGLEELLCAEISPRWQPRVEGQGRVQATPPATATLADLFAVRLAAHFGFPLPVRTARNSLDLVAAAMDTDAAARCFAGGKTWRLEWEDFGARRGVTRQLATQLAAKYPDRINETRQPDWELVVTADARRLEAELVPVRFFKAHSDPRFLWRSMTVDASSHMPLAAAMVRLSGPKPDDIVWDPFCGAGSELIERAIAGPARVIIGSDADGKAVAAATKNAAAAGYSNQITLWHLDLAAAASRLRSAHAVNVIITNPPLGRRVAPQLALALLDDLVTTAGQLLPTGGRLVWVTPDAAATNKHLEKQGLIIRRSQRVDMGGFHADLQLAVKK